MNVDDWILLFEVSAEQTGHFFFELKAARIHCLQKVWLQGRTTGSEYGSKQMIHRIDLRSSRASE
jgi:hypothetical protein